MKRFMFLSIGVPYLAIAAFMGFDVGSQNAAAQVPTGAQYFYARSGNYNFYIAILPNGDIYRNVDEGGPLFNYTPLYSGNFWGDTIAADQSTRGVIKGLYSK